MAEGDFPDVTIAVRDWLRSEAGVTGLVPAARIDIGTRSGPEPQIVVTRVGGGDDGSDAPVDQALVQIDVWGHATSASHGSASAAKRAVRSELWGLNRSPATVGTVHLYGASVVADVFLPDPESQQPRYVLTTQVTARST